MRLNGSQLGRQADPAQHILRFLADQSVLPLLHLIREAMHPSSREIVRRQHQLHIDKRHIKIDQG